MGFTCRTTLRLVGACAIIAGIGALAAGISVRAGTEVANPQHAQEQAVPIAQEQTNRAAPDSAEADSTAEDPWHKRWWIEKTARLLRNGQGLGPEDDVDYLETLPKEAIIRHFMEDEHFGEMALDFNMYFLGFKVDSLKTDGLYVHAAYDFSNAISSAKALLANEDYLRLFDLEGDYYMPPLSVTPSEDALPKEDARLTPQQLRQKVVDEFHARLEDLVAMREDADPIGFDEFCGEIEQLIEERDELQKRLFRAFIDTEIFVLMRGGIPDFVFNSLQQAVDVECAKGERNGDPAKLESAIWRASEQMDRAFNEIFKFEPTVYGPDSVAEMKPLDHRTFPRGEKWPAFGFEQGTALANSSTNFNRKRGAYILKRFFCDDLTPVGFDDPKQHVAGVHGTQTTCYSCHYKLDPMAGFFRNYGALFSDASDSPDIVFDDLASIDRKTYLSNWRAPDSTIREWEVGYIRSPRWTEKNSYGETLSDLSRIIRRAPEAKRCLMTRLTQYVLGEEQTVDGRYLDKLTANFIKDAKENSSQAFKNALLHVLQSNAFAVRNPDPMRCYDGPSSAGDDKRPPCRIAYILEKSCVQCHDGKHNLIALNLSKWIDAPGGAGKTFEHFTSKGEQIPASKTMARIAKRLSTNDPGKRMPRNRPMSSQERQELFLWTQKQLKQLSPQRKAEK